MGRVCTRAAQAGVAVGAQVSYRDLAGFGRRFIDVDPAELTDDVLYQLAALDGIARVSRHPRRPTSSRTARSTTPSSSTRPRRVPSWTAVAAYDARLPVLGLPGLGAAAGGGGGRAAHGRARASPTAATPPPARWCRAASPAPSCTTRGGGRAGGAHGRRRRGRRGRRDAGGGRGRLDLRARGHPGRGRAGPGGADGAGGGRACSRRAFTR